jgi:hypothetical protein
MSDAGSTRSISRVGPEGALYYAELYGEGFGPGSIASEPAGLKLSAGLLSEAALFQLRAIEGSSTRPVVFSWRVVEKSSDRR